MLAELAYSSEDCREHRQGQVWSVMNGTCRRQVSLKSAREECLPKERRDLRKVQIQSLDLFLEKWSLLVLLRILMLPAVVRILTPPALVRILMLQALVRILMPPVLVRILMPPALLRCPMAL